MKETRANSTISSKKSNQQGIGFLFDKANYRLMLVGLAVLALGFILMAGGKSNNPNVFDKNEVYSPMRITVAPIIILIGFVIEIFAIFRTPKNNEAAK